MNDKQLQLNNYRLSKHFFMYEFICKCGECTFDADRWVDSTFILRLEGLRQDFGRPLLINSGARCINHNHLIGGHKNSAHLVTADILSRAADIDTRNFSSQIRFDLIRLAFRYGFRGIGVADSFLHIDTKDRKALWTY